MDMADDEELNEIGMLKYCSDVNRKTMVRVAAQSMVRPEMAGLSALEAV
jgi:hypothetical protein